MRTAALLLGAMLVAAGCAAPAGRPTAPATAASTTPATDRSSPPPVPLLATPAVSASAATPAPVATPAPPRPTTAAAASSAAPAALPGAPPDPARTIDVGTSGVPAASAPTEASLRRALLGVPRRERKGPIDPGSCSVIGRTAGGQLRVACSGHECHDIDRETHFSVELRGSGASWRVVTSSEHTGPSTGACGCMSF